MKTFIRNLNRTNDALTVQLRGLWRVALMIVAGVLMSNMAFAQSVSPGVAPIAPPPGGFGIDGDLRANTPTANIGDWLPGAVGSGSGGNVLDASGNPLNNTTTYHSIDLYTSGDDVFAGGQKKNDNPNTMKWIEGNPSPAKNDINNLLMHYASDPGPGPGTGDIWIVLSGDREATNGNSFISIALHQKMLTQNNNGTFTSAASDLTGGRTPGDVQVSAEFTGGGGSANLYLEEWKLVDGVYQWAPIVLPPGVSINDLAFGTTNAVTLTGVPYDAFGGSSYQANALIEVAFNISEIYRNTSTPCVGSISSMFVMTKSSQAVSANLTDFVTPIQINLDINVSLTAEDPTPVCSPNTIDLADAITSDISGVNITYWDGDPDDENSNELNSSVVSASGTYWIKAASDQQNACTDKVSVEVTINSNPTVTVNSPTVCTSNLPATITATPGTGVANDYDYAWTIPSGATAPGNVSSFSTSIAGTYSVVITHKTTGCVSASASGTLAVNPNPDADAGADPAAQCYISTGNTFSLNGTASNGTILWTVAPSGNPNTLGVSFNDATLEDPSVTITGGSGSVTLRMTVTSNSTPSCGSDFDDVTVTVNAEPTPPVASYIPPACDEATFKVQVTKSSTDNGATYYIVDKDGDFISGVKILDENGDYIQDADVDANNTVSSYSPPNGNVVFYFSNIPAGSGFQVEVVSEAGCSSGTTICPVPVPAPGILNSEATNTLKTAETKELLTVYPVPFSDKATIEFTAEKEGEYVINLYDMKGVLIKQLKAGSARAGEVTTVEVDGRTMPEGMYLARMVNGKGAKTIKLLKKN
ncbi:T9SS type A sorting domain-containing protein [Botryobacter ruber]|uniref:T9SS type A sorting domain-containing protein n=1 Tax=Botryobacter ruber TaxID=2171629 RepID=UPI001F0C1304|nr:T9SS type A sorting domain-containing protein [Botryobacter ruber]